MFSKLQKFLRKYYDLLRSHIWVSLTGTVLLFFMGIILIFQNYLKNQYYNYLVAENGKTETAVLSVISENINKNMSDALYVGGKIAVSKSLEKDVDAAKDRSYSDWLNHYLNLKAELQAVSSYSTEIADVAIVTEDGVLAEYGKNWTSGNAMEDLWTGDDESYALSLYNLAMSKCKDGIIGKYVVSTEPAYHPKQQTQKQMFHVAYPLLGGQKNYDQVDAVVIISFYMENIIDSDVLSASVNRNYACSFITDEVDTLIYHTEREMQGTKLSDYLNTYQLVDYQEELSFLGWKAHIAIDTNDIREEVDKLYQKGLRVYLILMVICIMAWFLFLRFLMRPVTIIGNAMRKVQKGNKKEKIQVSGTNELWQLAEEYNRMMDALQDQELRTQQEFEEKTRFIEERNAAEMEALGSQINAHFLCNTLNAINYNVLESGNYEVARLLKRLASILNYAFSKKITEVTIGQEIEWIDQYLYLQKYRMSDSFDYKIDFPVEYGEWPCCKLFLQPFVENSIIHGFEKEEQGGKITITGTAHNEFLVIRVRDNGCGMTGDTKTKMLAYLEKHEDVIIPGSGTGIGVRNVITRMRLFFGARFKVELETEAGKGTCFTFWLPLPMETEEAGLQEGEDL